MLTEEQIHAFQQFQTAIDSLNELVNSANLNSVTLHQKIQSLFKLFQIEIQPIQSEDYQTHSVLVEINKQMRLLSMDGMFLRTARQVETIQTRIEQIDDRIKRLTEYCAAILALQPD